MQSNYSGVIAIAKPYQKSVLHFLVVNYIKQKEDENTNINLRRGFVADWKYALNFPDSGTDLISIHFGYTFIHLDKSKQLRIVTQYQFILAFLLKNLLRLNLLNHLIGMNIYTPPILLTVFCYHLQKELAAHLILILLNIRVLLCNIRQITLLFYPKL